MIWLKYNVPSLKNSKIKTSRGIFHSKTVAKYLRLLGIQKYSASKQLVIGYKTRPNLFQPIANELKKQVSKQEYPIKIGFHFVRDSKRKFDFHNAVQIIADLLVAHKVIKDDNMDCFIPIPFRIKGEYYTYNKESPGVFIKIY